MYPRQYFINHQKNSFLSITQHVDGTQNVGGMFHKYIVLHAGCVNHRSLLADLLLFISSFNKFSICRLKIISSTVVIPLLNETSLSSFYVELFLLMPYYFFYHKPVVQFFHPDAMAIHFRLKLPLSAASNMNLAASRLQQTRRFSDGTRCPS